VQVEVSGSEVTLSGTVNSWSEREMARRSAWASPGVHHVVDHIKIDYADLNLA
ncbi:ornithine aminotransferase, partial [Pelomonas sp. HMWF004]